MQPSAGGEGRVESIRRALDGAFAALPRVVELAPRTSSFPWANA
ncbi:MAG TPA: hypothetical protein VGR35_06065 [Tepidisphaeraceae bacterium]|nr:hypothetical protein [Tepidisphaeraceae bacterium]